MSYTLMRRSYYRRDFEGTDSLFAAVWREYRQMTLDGEPPTCDDDVFADLDLLAAKRVFNPASRFFVGG